MMAAPPTSSAVENSREAFADQAQDHGIEAARSGACRDDHDQHEGMKCLSDVRFTPESGHRRKPLECPLTRHERSFPESVHQDLAGDEGLTSTKPLSTFVARREAARSKTASLTLQPSSGAPKVHWQD